jgi:hypothetical protein
MRTLPLFIVVAASALALLACDESDDRLTRNSAISACGGFFGANSAHHKDPMGDPATYCDAQVLWWSYTSDTQVLALSDNRVDLNCCGDHSIDVDLVDGVYVVTETDAPQANAGGARCGCSCVFDFSTEIVTVPEGTVQLRIVRNVTDSEAGPETAWEGSLDLTDGSGHETIDASAVVMNCEVPTV